MTVLRPLCLTTRLHPAITDRIVDLPTPVSPITNTAYLYPLGDLRQRNPCSISSLILLTFNEFAAIIIPKYYKLQYSIQLRLVILLKIIICLYLKIRLSYNILSDLKCNL